MRKFILILCFSLVSWDLNAKVRYSFIKEAQILGYVCGQGLACKSAKYDDFELLARAILITKAQNRKELTEAGIHYLSKRAEAYVGKKLEGMYDCREIVQAFDKQEIFKSRLLADGTIYMYDGTVLKPKNPYDVTQIYKKDPNIRKNVEEIYNSRLNSRLKKAEKIYKRKQIKK